MRKQLFQALILAVAVGVPVYLWAATFGGFGDRLDQAKETGFFNWFHLTQTAQEEVAGATVTSFKPSGKQFHDLATLKVTTGTDGAITGMELVLTRGFVDSAKDGIFARDIAKSLLRTVFATGADQEVQDLADQIEYLGTSSSTIILHASRKPPKLPAAPTPGYLAYLGRQQSYEHAVAGKTLRLENAAVNGEKALFIMIRKK
jgi:hypothetical protein